MRIIIVNSEMQSRQMLRQALGALSKGTSIYTVSSLINAREEIQSGGTTDIVFIAEEFGDESIRSFLVVQKTRAETRDCAFVLLTRGGIEPVRASSLLVGQGAVDGFLFEPFSVDGLAESIELSKRVKNDRYELREKVAFRILIHQIADQLNSIWQLRSAAYGTERAQKLLRETCSVLQELSSMSKERFIELLADEFAAIKLPRKLSPRNPLLSTSSRVRQRAEEKMIAQHEAEARRACLALREVAA